MAIFETVDIATIDNASLVPAEMLTVGKAMAALLAFMQGDAVRVSYKCDGATWSALRRAAASVTNTPKDRKRDQIQYRIGEKGAWRNLKKGATAPKHANTRTVVIPSWTSDAVNAGIATLRDRGVNMQKLAESVTVGDVRCVVAVLDRTTADAS